ncbi:hypothetical protein [Spirosoma arcticum]
MESKAFTDCTLTYLEKTFGLVQEFGQPALTHWLAMPVDLSDHERRELRDFQEPLTLNVLHWNEQELSLNFIGPVFALVRFTSRKFNLFAQRPLRATISEIELYGRPDAFVASGFREPEIPFFAFHEFKRDIEPIGHPAAQTLAAMLAGQALSANLEQPIYGCYVNGRDWNFMTLTGQTYCISSDYSALTDDLFDIFRILKALKQLVIERTA